MEAKQTPLIDLLEGVPRDTVLVVEHGQFNSSFHPVGRLCHEAAAELRRVHAQAAQDEDLLRQALEALSRSRQTAMEQTIKARIPECAEFAGIAQDLDFVVAALRERLSEKE
jgi:hypothetical protein